MKKNVKRLAFAGLVLLTLSFVCFAFILELNKFGNNVGLLVIAVLFALSIIFFSISSNLHGKGNYLIFNDLEPGVRHVLVKQISGKDDVKFSLISFPESNTHLTFYDDERLSFLENGDEFIRPLDKKNIICKIAS
ncbi:MAG: hypothetical protein PF572_02865 [Patescibacteria group bacterium]|jgi:hypothetical protein|nr:hypothetical protein [Patescibacteria group bacterium]